MKINLEENPEYTDFKKRYIYVEKEFRDKFYTVKINTFYTDDNKDVNEYKYEDKLEMYEDLFIYLDSKKYLDYEPTNELFNFYYQCDEDTVLFNILLKKNLNEKIIVYFRVNKLESIENPKAKAEKEFKEWVEKNIYSNIKLRINFDNSFIKEYYNEEDKSNYINLRRMYLTDLMLNNNENYLNIYINNLYNDIFYGMKNFEIKYFLEPIEIENLINDSKNIICKYKDIDSNEIKTNSKIFNTENIELDSKIIIYNLYKILFYNAKKNNKITILQEKEKKLLIICLYEIKETEILNAEIIVKFVKAGIFDSAKKIIF